MKNIYKILISLVVVLLIFILGLYDYKRPDKQIILSNNAQEVLNSEENTILDLIQNGNNYLISNDFEKAKKSYEEAISKNTSREKTYLDIKDSYINKDRLDDAYYIMKLAIDNNISNESFKLTLEEIKSTFEAATIDKNIIQYTKFTLPSEVEIPINNTPTTVNVRWDDLTNVDTSKVGNYSFKGYVDEHGRSINYNLSIEEKPAPILSTKIGFIQNYSLKGNDLYISLNEVEFFTGEAAKKEVIKDNAIGKLSPNGAVYDDYYLRDNSPSTKSYKLSQNANIKVCSYLYDDLSPNSASLRNSSISEFKSFIDARGGLLFWINTEDDVVVNIKMQYKP